MTASSNFIQAFPPLVDADSRLLILGSMPSVQSLQKQQYYGHPQNAFWRIIHDLWDQPLPADYGQRTRFLLAHRIALWDILAACERTGSADAAIRAGQANDFQAFLQAWPQIRRICFNGQAAARLFNQLVLKKHGWQISENKLTGASLGPGLQVILLPSTSPAHAVSYTAKLAAWQVVRQLSDLPGDGPSTVLSNP